MTRVLVTGGAGFIGSHLVDRLVRDGAEVTVLDRLPPEQARHLEAALPRIRYLEGDIRDPDAVRQAFEPRPDLVYHMASIVGVGLYVEDPLAVVDIVVGGTRSVLREVGRVGSRLVLASPSEVFGRNPEVPWSEDADRVLGSTSVDRWSYGSSKAVAEHMVFAMMRGGMEASIVRFFNAYGPRQAPIFVVSQSVRKVLRGERPLVYDDGRQTRCFTYVADAVGGLVAAGTHPAAPGEAFNIGNPVETTMREVVDRIVHLSGTGLEPETFHTDVEYGERYEDVPRRVPGVEKARELLGWSASTTLDEGLAATLAWARANPWWWEDGAPEAGSPP
jgi:dTDP-alpha-D-glucuronic acid decarboxylase